MAGRDDPSDIDVRKVARLARLAFADDQLPALSRELRSILEHVQGLNELQLDRVEPLSHPTDQEALLADDVPAGELSHEQLERMAPRMDGPFLHVPKVLGDGQGA
ncbi:MAG: Asp-tRNA(Asn)/Glu-tRNA(Gln) amidotransferase subunit GatC [Phycisphaerales bacterium]